MKNSYQCLRCKHQFEVVQPAQPWYGWGYDRNMNFVEHQSEKEMRPHMPNNPDCSKCGNQYLVWLDYRELRRESAKLT